MPEPNPMKRRQDLDGSYIIHIACADCTLMTVPNIPYVKEGEGVRLTAPPPTFDQTRNYPCPWCGSCNTLVKTARSHP